MLSSSEFHKDFQSFYVHTHEIGVNGLRLELSASMEALCALIAEPSNKMFSWKASKESTVSFWLERENEHTYKVTLDANLNLFCPCVRCLAPTDLVLKLNFTIRMLQKEGLGIRDDSHESLDLKFDSFDEGINGEHEQPVGYFSNQRIDLGAILREQIFLEVPDFPRCRGIDGSEISCQIKEAISPQDGYRPNENPFVKIFGKSK